MTYYRPSPIDTITVINTIKDFINNTYSGVSGSPIIDPLSEASLTRGSGTGLAVYEDETNIMSGHYPKITFEVINPGESTRLSQGKTDYREKQKHEFLIIYTCHKSYKWTYPTTTGTPYVGKQQCIRYLQYLRNQLKKYSGNFGSFNEIVCGQISNVTTNEKSLTYQAAMPIKIDTYGGRIE